MLLSEIHLFGEDYDITESQKARIDDFAKNVLTADRKVVDSTNALKLLQKETPAFSQEQRRQMGRIVTEHMKGSSATSPKEKATEGKSQTHMYIHEWLVATLWIILFDDKVSFDDKIDKLVEFLIVVLGLRHPSDPTVKTILAIALLCHDRKNTPEENYEWVRKIHDKFTNVRPLTPGSPTYKEFPKDP